MNQGLSCLSGSGGILKVKLKLIYPIPSLVLHNLSCPFLTQLIAFVLSDIPLSE